MRVGIYIILIWELVSCKESDHILSRYSGKVGVFRNGDIWSENVYIEARSSYFTSDGFDLTFDSYNADFIRNESISLYKIGYEEGMYALDTFGARYDTAITGASYTTFALNVGASCEVYKPLNGDTFKNHVKIDFYNEKTRIVEGTFDVTMIKWFSECGSGPDTIRFSDGWFRTRIKE